MIDDPLSGLSLFLVVAEKRSFTGAAKALRVTPSAVSQWIRALERRLGVRLLQRTTRSVGLTEAGDRFVARLRPAVGEVRAPSPRSPSSAIGPRAPCVSPCRASPAVAPSSRPSPRSSPGTPSSRSTWWSTTG